MKPETKAIIDTCAKFNWRKPPWEPGRIVDAFERRIALFPEMKDVKFKMLTVPDVSIKSTPRAGAQITGEKYSPTSPLPDSFQTAITALDEVIPNDLFKSVDPMMDDLKWPRRWRFVMHEIRMLVGLVESESEQEAKDYAEGRPTLRRVYEPMLDALMAGAFLFAWPSRSEIAILRCPTYGLNERKQLHGEGVPALTWGDKTNDLYFWKSVKVPEHAIMNPSSITLEEIEKTQNQELRRALMECFGLEKYVRKLGKCIDDSQEALYGTLWERPERNVATRVLVCKNGTVEPDGTRKTFALFVPRDCKTALEAAAWTYDMTVEEYKDLVVRT